MEIINPETLAMLTALDPELAKAYAERCLNAPEPSQKEKEANKQTFVFHNGEQTVNVNCNFIEGKSSNRKANSSNNTSSNASSSSNKPGNPAPPAPPQQELTAPTLNQEEADALKSDNESGDLIDEDEVNEVDTTTSSSLDLNDLNTVPNFIT